MTVVKLVDWMVSLKAVWWVGLMVGKKVDSKESSLVVWLVDAMAENLECCLVGYLVGAMEKLLAALKAVMKD